MLRSQAAEDGTFPSLRNTDDTQDNDTEHGNVRKVSRDQPFEPDDSGDLCARLNDKWTIVVLWRVASATERRVRFSALKREIKGITQRMLTFTLRSLERDGLVNRHVFAEVPPRVEYELTQMGAGMLEALGPLNRWIVANMPQIDQCRRVYDSTSSID